jgi:arabinogalactan oligomer / maltooligosaccharide transport system substrate-binding protein
MATKVLIQGADVQKSMDEAAQKFKSDVVPDYSLQ